MYFCFQNVIHSLRKSLSLAALLEDFRKICRSLLHIRIVAPVVKVALMTPLSSSIYAFSSLSLSLHQLFFFVFRSLSFFLHSLALILFFQIMGRVHLSFSTGPPTLFYGICGVTENNFFRWLIATNAAICHNSLSSIRERNSYWCWR